MTSKLSPRHAAYLGSFDPLTLGHLDIIRRGAEIFETLTVGIGINPDKKPLFTSEERLELTSKILSPFRNVSIYCFEGLAVDFVRSRGAAVMLRGVRTLTDMESEFTMSLTNRVLAPDIETVFLMASEKYTHISSTLIRQIARMGRDDVGTKLHEFLPAEIVQPLLERSRHR